MGEGEEGKPWKEVEGRVRGEIQSLSRTQTAPTPQTRALAPTSLDFTSRQASLCHSYFKTFNLGECHPEQAGSGLILVAKQGGA